ncbi:uncharacterized protein LOC124885795 [Capsicum annuum]|uniref:uncharacterized protein LOC124885795 n=1 Tax=Capsicum annuum TaxID=4072 RepID=UPI001FB17F7A|nr:uncharacterized protein LOC124885795 [Capsicum annuum]
MGKLVVNEVVDGELEKRGPVESEKLDNSDDAPNKGKEKEKEKLGLENPTPTNMWLVMADRCMKRSVGILHDVLVKDADFILPANFVVLDCYKMAPKGKSSKSKKKVTKGSVSWRLFNEESDYEKEEPLLRKQKTNQSPKKPSLPLLVEVEGSEEKHDLDHPESEDNDFGQPESKGPSIESPSAEPQDEEESLIYGMVVKCKNLKGANVPKIVRLEEELLSKKTNNPIQNKQNHSRLMLDRGTKIPTDPPVTGTSSVPYAEMPDSKAVPPTSVTMEKLSMPRTEINPTGSVPTTEFAFRSINLRRVAK